MKKTILLTITVFLLFSCLRGLTSKHYKSPDKFTGGFKNFELNLEKYGKLELLIETSIAINQNNAGTIWEKRQKQVSGKWRIENGTIKCDFDETKKSIDSVFLNSSFEEFKERELIRFNEESDTVFIYGFPCIEKDEK